MKDMIKKDIKLIENISNNSVNDKDFLSELNDLLNNWECDDAEGASRHTIINSIRELMKKHNISSD